MHNDDIKRNEPPISNEPESKKAPLSLEDDFTYVTGEGLPYIDRTQLHNPQDQFLKHLINDQDFEDKLHHESYVTPKLDIRHDANETLEKKNSLRTLILIIICSAIIGVFAGFGYRVTDYYLLGNKEEIQIEYEPDLIQSDRSQKTNDTSDEARSIIDIAKDLEPSVVAITSEAVQNSLWGETVGTSSGSGVVFDLTTKHVYILTNNHVIENSVNLNVTFFGEHHYPAEIVGADPDSDLAVLIVKKDDIAVEEFEKIRKVSLGNSDDIQVGEMAIAIGNPLGYNNTVTVGVISALDRYISDDLNSLSLIQTDAAINPGNSGGALVNAYGELIGINTIKIADTAVEGIGFAIPINSAVPILEELILQGYVSRPFIGIHGRDVTEELAQLYDIPIGVFVNDIIARTPASRSSLKKYDIIVDIEGFEITTMLSLTQAINDFSVGDLVSMTVMRETDEGFVPITVEIEIGDRHDY